MMSFYRSFFRKTTDPDLPANFSPDQHPILAVHFFGLQPLGQAKVDRTILNLAFQRDVERLHRLGPRPQLELLREIEQRFGCGKFIRERVKRYAELDPAVVHATGGSRFPAEPEILLLEGGKS